MPGLQLGDVMELEDRLKKKTEVIQYICKGVVKFHSNLQLR
jgi:hypothetical protein